MIKEKLDLIQVSKDIKEIINDLQSFQLVEENKKIGKQLKDFYLAFTKKTLTVDERLLLLSKLHTMREFTGWFIGEILIKEEEKIKKEVEEWKNGKRVNPPRYNSLYDFITEHEGVLGFGKSTAYNYIGIRKKADFDTFLKLGVKKALLITSIKDEDLAKKIQKLAIQQNWTAERLRDRIDYFSRSEKNRKFDELNELKKKIDDEIMISSYLTDERIKENEILLSFENKEVKELFNDIFLDILPNIKEKIFNELELIRNYFLIT